MIGVLVLLVLAGIVIGVIVLVRRFMQRREEGSSDGADVLAYLLLALFVGVAGFALRELGRAAFPGDVFVSDATQRVALSLAGLVVATPIAVFLWRRQAERRQIHRASAGWTVYLSLIEAVFMTAFVIAAFALLDWLIGDAALPTWTDVLVFGGIVGFHEWASHRTPPGSDGADLPRVVGSAIGLVAAAIGLAGVIFWLLERIYASLTPIVSSEDIVTWLPFLIVGAPIWWYRWWRPWPGEPGAPRNAWTFLISVAGLATLIGSVVTITVQTLLYLFTVTAPAGTHFEFLPPTLAFGIVGALVWIHHTRRLGAERTNPRRAYEYSMAALGLGATIGAATALTDSAFGSPQIVPAGAEAIVILGTILVFALGVWLWFWSRGTAAPREVEATTGPRRFYLVGLSVITGLVSAGALIATLVVLFQRILDTGGGDSLAVQASLFVYSGLATWHLLRINAQDRALIVSDEVVTPFGVTIICSHPGMISTQFPKEAKLRVIYRDDDAGEIDEEMAAAIVEAVGHRDSIVWVDDEGFRVAPAR